MADLIKIKGGKGAVPELQDRELAYSKDGKALYIGTEDGNIRLCGADDIETLTTIIKDITARLEALEPQDENEGSN